MGDQCYFIFIQFALLVSMVMGANELLKLTDHGTLEEQLGKTLMSISHGSPTKYAPFGMHKTIPRPKGFKYFDNNRE